MKCKVIIVVKIKNYLKTHQIHLGGVCFCPSSF
nr:MAG TPA: hypothetical protein [Caudoviricetes sp.]